MRHESVRYFITNCPNPSISFPPSHVPSHLHPSHFLTTPLPPPLSLPHYTPPTSTTLTSSLHPSHLHHSHFLTTPLPPPLLSLPHYTPPTSTLHHSHLHYFHTPLLPPPSPTHPLVTSRSTPMGGWLSEVTSNTVLTLGLFKLATMMALKSVSSQ